MKRIVDEETGLYKTFEVSVQEKERCLLCRERRVQHHLCSLHLKNTTVIEAFINGKPSIVRHKPNKNTPTP